MTGQRLTPEQIEIFREAARNGVTQDVRIGSNPGPGRSWQVSLYTADGCHIGVISDGYNTKRDAERAAWRARGRYGIGIFAGSGGLEASGPVRGRGLDALFGPTPPPPDREAAIREAVGLLRDLERVIPSPRIAEVLAKLAT